MAAAVSEEKKEEEAEIRGIASAKRSRTAARATSAKSRLRERPRFARGPAPPRLSAQVQRMERRRCVIPSISPNLIIRHRVSPVAARTRNALWGWSVLTELLAFPLSERR